jgi:ubiquinone/menaquinone biosynthesis C-methylase UbiE
MTSRQEQKNIIDCYDKTAINYAEKFINELDNKHLARILLKAFISENNGKGRLIDLGCGPGQTTKFLFNNGFVDTIGVDTSTEMIRVAKQINPNLNFEQADILNLKFNDNSFGSAIAFYSIVHFDYDRVRTAFKEIKRVLTDEGELLFAFHIGDNIIHLDSFLDHQVEIDFHFFEVAKIKNILIEIGFKIVDIVVRQPYEDVEHQSERAYIWTKKSYR